MVTPKVALEHRFLWPAYHREDGSILDPAIQPGSGAVDVVASLQCSGRLRALGLGWSAAASYQMKTANKYDYRFGDDVIATVGVNRRLGGRLSASFHAKLFHLDLNRWLGETVPSTGATFVYLSPGLRWDAPGRVSLYGFVQIPGYRYVNEAQLAPRSAFLAGVSKTF